MSKDIAELRQLIESGFAVMASEFKAVNARLDSLDRRLVAVEARLDGQRHTINALIPTHLAAVPAARHPAPPAAE